LREPVGFWKGELSCSKGQEVSRKLEDVEQQLRINERKLHHLKENRRSFTKNMLKFGFASWVFALAVFFLAIAMMNAKLFEGAPLAWSSMLVGIPLLVGAPAAPVTMTAVSAHKFDAKIKRLRRIRRGLVEKNQRTLIEYRRTLLQYVKQVRP